MTEQRGHARIFTRRGTTYATLETLEEIQAQIPDNADEGFFLDVQSVNGQAAFPPERLLIRLSEVASLQSISDEAWVWQEQADTRYYSQALDQSAQDRLADAQAEIAAFLKSEVEGD